MKRKQLLALVLALTLVCESVPVSATETTGETEIALETEEAQASKTPESETAAQEQTEETTKEDGTEQSSVTETEEGTQTEISLEAQAETESQTESETEAVYHADDFVKPYLPEQEPVDIEATDIYAGLDDSLLTAEFPEKYDPRTENPQLVTSVINQDPWGTCWACAAAAVTETAMIKEELWDNSKHLSPNHMAYFANHTGKDRLDNATEDTMVQNKVQAGLQLGGNITLSAMTLMNWKGMASQDDCPYPATAEDVPIDEEKAQLHEAITKDYLFVPTKDSSIAEQVAVMKGLIQQYGAIDWSYKDVSNVLIDEADYYNENECAYYYDAPLEKKNPLELEWTNHEITVVGWDDNFSKENFGDPEATCDYDGDPAPQPEDDGAWLVKNSWGADWGDGGYFYISYYDALMSREPAAVTKVVPRDTYDNNYFWGNTNSDDTSSNIQKAAQVFQAKGETGQEELKAVSMMLSSDHVKYSIQVYKNPDTDEGNVVTNPESGTPMLTDPITGETGYAGLVTVDFKEHGVTEPLIFKKGDVMSIVITFPDQAATVYVDNGTDRRDDYRENEDGTKELLWSVESTNITHLGQSFIYDKDGLKDLYDENRNLRINALTSNMEPQYTVTFRDDKGNPIGEPQTVEKGKNATPPEAPEKRGYQFTGWDGSYENITTDTVLTAQYKKIEYTITYELDGGTNNENNPATYTIIEDSKDVILFEDPVRDGYAFMGWYTDIAMKEFKNLIDEGETGDLTLYARWVEETGDIIPPSFVPEDGIVEEGEYIAIWSNEDADIYYTMDGTDPVIEIADDGTITYKNGIKYEDPISISEDVTVKAVAIRPSRLDKSDVVTKEYIYYKMHLALEQETLSLVKGEKGTIAVTKRPTRAEEAAITWTSSDEKVATVSGDGEVTAVAKGTAVITATTTNYKDEPVTAECRVTVTNPIYQVTFLDYEGKQIGEAQQVEEGEDALPPESSKVPAKKGYQFAGWSGSYRKIKGDTVLRAEYKPISYNITYELNGGVNAADNPKSYTIEDDAVILHDPTRTDGALFVGWYDNQQCEGNAIDSIYDVIHSFDDGEWKDIILYAKFYREDGLWIEEIEDYVYTGKAIKPTGFAVYDGTKRLTEGVDYTVSYKNNVNANITNYGTILDAENGKAPLVIVKGKGNYKGTVKKNFKIRPVEINVTIDDIAVAQKNGNQKPNPAIKWGGKTLKSGKDYQMDVVGGYSAPGTYPCAAWGIGNYSFYTEFSFIITDKNTQKPVSQLKLTNKIGTLDWDAAWQETPEKLEEAIRNGITLKDGSRILTEGTDYSIGYAYDNTDAGTHEIIIRGQGKYAGVRRTSFKIRGIDIKKATVTGLPNSFSYSGNEQQPVLNISYEGTVLEKDKDYKVSYSSNTNAGTAKATIAGKGRFSGTKTVSFKITPVDASGLNISLEPSYDYEKGGVKPLPFVTYRTADGRELTLAEGTDYTLSYKYNTSYDPGADRKPTVTVKGRKNFTGSKTAEFKIEQQNLDEIGMILLPDMEYSAKPGKCYAKPQLFDRNGKKLAAGKDYDNVNITYYNETTKKTLKKDDAPQIGDEIRVTIKAAANGSYKGEITDSYHIVDKDKNLARAKITVRDKSKFHYTGIEVVPASTDLKVVLNGTELKPDDYQVVAYPNNPKKGSAKFLIIGQNGYGGQKTFTISIGSQQMEWWK